MNCKLLIVCLFIFHISDIHAKEIIQWFHSDYPPAHILTGEHAHKGYADLTLELIIDALPNYRHMKTKANYARSISELSQNINTCHASLLKSPDRLNDVIFSIPAYIVLSNKLFIHKDSRSMVQTFLNKRNKIDLNALLADKKFLLGIAIGAKYGKKIDNALQPHINGSQIFMRSANGQFLGLSKMVERNKRLDGVLGHVSEEKYFNSTNDDNSSELLSYFIDGAATYELGFIGCSNSEFGQKVIEQVNSILIKHRKNKIKKYYQNWLSNDEIKFHTELINSIFSTAK